MPSSFGYRARTRHMFARNFREKGMIRLSTYLTTYRIGDIVDVKANGAVQKGMPFKYYHGKTGRVWNVTRRAVGVEINKQVGNRVIPKRILVRIEHVKHSRSREEFLRRVKENDKIKHAAKVAGKPVPSTKRPVVLPLPAFTVDAKKCQLVTLEPKPYEFMV